MTRLLKTNTKFEDEGRIDNFTLDLAYGDDENDFEVTVPARIQLERKTLLYVPETEWGGLIREESATRDSGVSWRTYAGPTWHGLYDQRVLVPPDGATHLVLSGDLNQIIAQVIVITGLGAIFEASPVPTGVNITWTFDRFCTALEGLRKMLNSYGYRLCCKRGAYGKTVTSAVKGSEYIDDNKGSKFGYSLSVYHPVNHYVCVGEGEMDERILVHLFADTRGDVSQTQTIFGLDEIQRRYEYTSADKEQLIKSARESLKAAQVLSRAELKIPDGGNYLLDDVVGVADAALGKEFFARINKIIVKCQSKGRPQVSFDFTDVEARNLPVNSILTDSEDASLGVDKEE